MKATKHELVLIPFHLIKNFNVHLIQSCTSTCKNIGVNYMIFDWYDYSADNYLMTIILKTKLFIYIHIFFFSKHNDD